MILQWWGWSLWRWRCRRRCWRRLTCQRGWWWRWRRWRRPARPPARDRWCSIWRRWTLNKWWILSLLFILSLFDKDLLVWWTTRICLICPQPWSRTLRFKVNYSFITSPRKLFLLQLESSQFTWGYTRPWARQTVENCLEMSLKMRSNNTITVIDINNHWSTATIIIIDKKNSQYLQWGRMWRDRGRWEQWWACQGGKDTRNFLPRVPEIVMMMNHLWW